MLRTPAMFGLLSLGVMACAPADAGDAPKTSTRAAINEIQWGQTPFGPLASPVSGNFAEGAHITYVKFKSGMATPLHTHSHDYVGIVVTGTTRHYTPGKPETEKLLPAGSHWFMPGGEPHISECIPGAECIMAIYQTDSMDFHPVQ